MNLVIVESPAKAKTINKYLGDNYTVLASYGHIRDLPKKNLGIDLESFCRCLEDLLKKLQYREQLSENDKPFLKPL